MCIVVDDFGLHADICAAAMRLHAKDRVHAIGCMVGGGVWSHWHHLLARLDAREVDIGLHLDLTERPISGMPAFELGALIRATLTRRLDRPTVRTEICAQLDAFEHVLGRAPAFVDGHQHVHQLPIVRDALLDELNRRYAALAPPRRPWLRSTACASGTGRGWQGTFKQRVIANLGSRRLVRDGARLGFAHNRHLLGVYDFRGDAARYEALIAGWLDACVDADLLMCHPAIAATAPDPVGAARAVEYQVLSSAAFGNRVRERGIVLQPMSRVLSHGG